RVGGRPLLGRNQAGEAMHRVAADRDGIVERLAEQRRELLLAAGHRGKPRLARTPERRVEPKHRDTVALDLRLEHARRMVVGHLKFDRAKPGGLGGADALWERALGEEVREIGGEAGHGGGTPYGRLTLYHHTRQRSQMR